MVRPRVAASALRNAFISRFSDLAGSIGGRAPRVKRSTSRSSTGTQPTGGRGVRLDPERLVQQRLAVVTVTGQAGDPGQRRRALEARCRARVVRQHAGAVVGALEVVEQGGQRRGQRRHRHVGEGQQELGVAALRRATRRDAPAARGGRSGARSGSPAPGPRRAGRGRRGRVDHGPTTVTRRSRRRRRRAASRRRGSSRRRDPAGDDDLEVGHLVGADRAGCAWAASSGTRSAR